MICSNFKSFIKGCYIKGRINDMIASSLKIKRIERWFMENEGHSSIIKNVMKGSQSVFQTGQTSRSVTSSVESLDLRPLQLFVSHS